VSAGCVLCILLIFVHLALLIRCVAHLSELVVLC